MQTIGEQRFNRVVCAAYLLLFEVWPRYLFVFALFSLLLAGMEPGVSARRKA